MPGVAVFNNEKTKKPIWFLRHSLLEVYVTLAAAGVAWMPPFSNPDLAYLISVLGALFAVGRFGMTEVLKEDRQAQGAELSKRFVAVDRLSEFVDLSSNSGVTELRTLVDRHSQIVDQEFFEAKEEVIHTALTRLNKIIQERRTDQLSTGAYYKFLLDLLANVKSGETLFAVSTGELVEWDDSPQEGKFFEANLKIIEGGGKVKRYFVYPKAGFIKAKKENEKVAAHFTGTGLEGRFVDSEKLQSTDSALFKAIGQGFIMVGRRIAVVDAFGDQPRGYVTKNSDELDRFWNALQQLNNLASAAPKD